MNILDSQQRGLAGEYYVAYILTRLGYDIGITMGRAKIFDIKAMGSSGKTNNIQVNSIYSGYDWLITRSIDTNPNSVIALVRLGKSNDQKPELYFLPGSRASKMVTPKYVNNSPRISRADVKKDYKDHDFQFIENLLERG